MSEHNTGKSIWENMPEEWAGKNIYEEQHTQIPEEETIVKPVPQSSANDPIPEVKNEPANEAVSETVYVSSDQLKEKRKTRAERKAEKEKYREYERVVKESRINSSEQTREAYLSEKTANRRDYTILGIAGIILFAVIIAVIIISSRTSTQRIYRLIEQGNYATAYQSIKEYHDKGRNVDSLVYEFVNSCISDSEYKRAVAALDFLSSDASKHIDFFSDTIDTLISHGKANRALEVLEYMDRQGGELQEAAYEIYEEHRENF